MKNIILFMVCFLLFACGSDPASQVEGAWKSEKINSLKGKPSCLVFEKDTVFTDGGSFKADYTEKKGIILVSRIGTVDPIFTITPQKDTNLLEIYNWVDGTKIYKKTTKEDVENIRNTAVKLEVKPDPF